MQWTRCSARSAASRGASGTRQSEARTEGRCLGLGIASYVEGTGVGPFESATVRIEPTGTIYVTSGACPQGRVWDKFRPGRCRHLGCQTRRGRHITADTSLIAIGSAPSPAAARLRCRCHRLRKRTPPNEGLRDRREHDGNAPADLESRNGKVGVAGVPGIEVTLASVAQAARPGWNNRRPEGIDAGLEESLYWEPPTVTWSNGTHLAQVEVDIASGAIKIEQYVVAHDCGVVINPLLVEGQTVFFGGSSPGPRRSPSGRLRRRLRQVTLLIGSLDGLGVAKSERQPRHATAPSRIPIAAY